MKNAKSSRSNHIYRFLVILVLHAPVFGYAQDTTNATIDSLIMQLMTDHEDAAKADVYNALSDEYLLLDYNRSMEYANLGYNLSEKLDYSEGILRSSMALAHLNMNYRMDFATANEYYNEALPLAQTLKDREAEMKIYRGISYVHRESKNLTLAQEFNQKALDIATTLENYAFESDLKAYMGGLHEQQGDTLAAIEVYGEVLELEKANDFTATPNASHIAIARYYYLTNEAEQSLKYYRIALKTFERNKDTRWTSYTHSEMANLYVFTGDLKRAEQHAVKGLAMAEENQLLKEMGDNYRALITIYTDMDSLDKAAEYTRIYDSLQLSLKPVAGTPDALVTDAADETAAATPSEKMNGFLQAIIILLPVLVLVAFAGRPRKKK